MFLIDSIYVLFYRLACKAPFDKYKSSIIFFRQGVTFIEIFMNRSLMKIVAFPFVKKYVHTLNVICQFIYQSDRLFTMK